MTRIRAYGYHVVLLRMVEANKGVKLFTPDAYKDDSILWGRVCGIGSLAKKALPEIELGDVILFKQDSALGRATTHNDFDTFLINAVDCLAYEKDKYGRRYAQENYP
jgi:co-chaperonin GroES (HSP10)